MSFIEKNKVWLLPLLAAGILGVGYMNFRTFTGEPETTTPSPSENAVPETVAPAEAEAPMAEGSTPTEQTEGEEGASADAVNLWADLTAFAVVPGELAQEGPLRDRARLAIDPALTTEAPLVLDKPARPSLQPPQAKGGGGVSTVTTAPPQLDFLIHSPQGSFAWFGGRGYRTGETLAEGGFVVNRIGTTFVELTGPGGQVLEYTNPLHSNRKTASDIAEAP